MILPSSFDHYHYYMTFEGVKPALQATLLLGCILLCYATQLHRHGSGLLQTMMFVHLWTESWAKWWCWCLMMMMMIDDDDDDDGWWWWWWWWWWMTMLMRRIMAGEQWPSWILWTFRGKFATASIDDFSAGDGGERLWKNRSKTAKSCQLPRWQWREPSLATGFIEISIVA